jgi:hypothetical protein
MASVPGQQLTDMWMVNPSMFDPTGWAATDPYSQYQNAALPFPPTYGNPLGGGPVNAATGQPIQSYRAPQPVYTSWSSTPGTTLNQSGGGYSTLLNPGGGQGGAAQNGWSAGGPPSAWSAFGVPGIAPAPGGQVAGQSQGAQQGGSWSTPNNWYAALQALANPTGGQGVQTPGATVPLQQGYQPAGGVNQAFLQQRGWGGPGPTGNAPVPMGRGPSPVNNNFMSALAAIQGRPQQF